MCSFRDVPIWPWPTSHPTHLSSPLHPRALPTSARWRSSEGRCALRRFGLPSPDTSSSGGAAAAETTTGRTRPAHTGSKALNKTTLLFLFVPWCGVCAERQRDPFSTERERGPAGRHGSASWPPAARVGPALQGPCTMCHDWLCPSFSARWDRHSPSRARKKAGIN